MQLGILDKLLFEIRCHGSEAFVRRKRRDDRWGPKNARQRAIPPLMARRLGMTPINDHALITQAPIKAHPNPKSTRLNTHASNNTSDADERISILGIPSI